MVFGLLFIFFIFSFQPINLLFCLFEIFQAFSLR